MRFLGMKFLPGYHYGELLAIPITRQLVKHDLASRINGGFPSLATIAASRSASDPHQTTAFTVDGGSNNITCLQQMIALFNAGDHLHSLKESSRIVCACHSLGRVAFVFFRSLGIEVGKAKKGLKFTLNGNDVTLGAMGDVEKGSDRSPFEEAGSDQPETVLGPVSSAMNKVTLSSQIIPSLSCGRF